VPLPLESAVLTGAYVELDALLALRYKRLPQRPSQSAQVFGHRAGLKLSKIKGRGVDFSEVRSYQPGDDVRSIDWRVTARKNKPHTKVFREERERPNLLVVDQSQNMFFGSKIRLKSVAAAELAARIAWQNLAAGDRVGGVIIGNTKQTVHRPYRTTKSVSRFLGDLTHFNRQLKRAQHNPWQSINDGILRIRRLSGTHYRIFIISDFAGDLGIWREHLHQLARHNQVFVIRVHDPLEQQLPPADDYVVTDGIERIEFNTSNYQLRSRYAERFAARSDALMAACMHDSIRYLDIATNHTQLDQMAWI